MPSLRGPRPSIPQLIGAAVLLSLMGCVDAGALPARPEAAANVPEIGTAGMPRERAVGTRIRNDARERLARDRAARRAARDARRDRRRELQREADAEARARATAP